MTGSARALRGLLAAALTALLAIAFVACGGDNGDDSGDGDGGATGGVSLECQDGRILVGIAKSDSGVGSFFDIAGKRGLEIAIDEINEEGGIKDCPIETISEDTQSDPAVGAQVARSLIDEGAQILIVPDDFDLGIAAARVGQEAGVLTLSTAASSTEFASAVGDLFFSGGITTIELGRAQAQFAVDEGWMSTFFVVDPGLAYFTEQVDNYTALYEEEGGEIAGRDEVDSLGGQSDFSSTISQIRNANPDVINVQMVFPQAGTFVRQLRNAGVDSPVVGNVTLQTREMQELVGRNRLNDVYYAAQVYFNGAGVDPKTDPGIASFAERYEEKFGNFPEQANGPGSYQVFLAVNEALQQEDVTDAASAAEAIRAQENLEVPGGTLVRWQDGYAVWNPTIVGFTPDGEFEQVTTFDAAELSGE